MNITAEETKLLEYSKEAVVRLNQLRHANGGIDTLYALLLSEAGNIYEGACYEPNIAQATICGERHAIANLVFHVDYNSKIASIVVADPVPAEQEQGTPPCGTFRHLIWSHGTPATTVLLQQYIQHKNSWSFPKLEKFTIAELYPHPYEPKPALWDNWQPK